MNGPSTQNAIELLKDALQYAEEVKAQFGASPISNTQVNVLALDMNNETALVIARTAWHDIGWGPDSRWVPVQSLQNITPIR